MKIRPVIENRACSHLAIRVVGVADAGADQGRGRRAVSTTAPRPTTPTMMMCQELAGGHRVRRDPILVGRRCERGVGHATDTASNDAYALRIGELVGSVPTTTSCASCYSSPGRSRHDRRDRYHPGTMPDPIRPFPLAPIRASAHEAVSRAWDRAVASGGLPAWPDDAVRPPVEVERPADPSTATSPATWR